MSSAGRWVSGALAGAAFLGLAALPGGARGAAFAREAVGPESVERAPGAVVARDVEELRRLVADAHGPREIALEATTYRLDLAIARPLALRGARGAVIEGTGTGTVITIDADDVTVENVIVRGAGHRNTTEDAGIRARGNRIRIARASVDKTLFGISLAECHGCLLERSYVRGPDDDVSLRGDGIKLWESHDSVVRDNVVDNVRDVVVWYSRRVLLERNTVRNSRYGAHFMYAADGVLREARVIDNVVGIFVMYSSRLRVEKSILAGARGAAGIGLGFKESDGVIVRGNWIVANTTGSYLDTTPRSEAEPVQFEDNVVGLNDVALRFHGARAGAHFRRNSFRDNGTLVEVDGGSDVLATEFRSNFYTDYDGYDTDGDGLGDVPFEFTRLSGELSDAHPSLQFFRGTFAMGLVDTISHALPVLRAHVLLRDPSPSLRPRNVEAP